MTVLTNDLDAEAKTDTPKDFTLWAHQALLQPPHIRNLGKMGLLKNESFVKLANLMWATSMGKPIQEKVLLFFANLDAIAKDSATGASLIEKALELRWLANDASGQITLHDVMGAVKQELLESQGAYLLSGGVRPSDLIREAIEYSERNPLLIWKYRDHLWLSRYLETNYDILQDFTMSLCSVQDKYKKLLEDYGSPLGELGSEGKQAKLIGETVIEMLKNP